jgi:ABC-type Zn2+ transport system substrate-binding protein/surface adhesin
MEAHNAFAGQGPVMLDIGDDIGALVVDMPSGLEGVEVEIRPVGAAEHQHHHHHDEHDDHRHDHDEHDDDHQHPHVAVVARPTADGRVPSLVFGDLREGEYELYERLDGRVRLTAVVRGGEVTQASWPS